MRYLSEPSGFRFHCAARGLWLSRFLLFPAIPVLRVVPHRPQQVELKTMYQADALHPNPSLERKLQGIYTLNRDKTVDLSFRPPYLDLLRKLGDPHLHLPPVIHVAGTNGKGSTVAFMRAVLEAAGYRVHAYTSPHLVRFNERIVLAGREIADDALEALLDETLALNGDGALTFFEVTTALAFAAFARTPADILLLETGLGGRLDCTNVIRDPAATVITPIGYDHMEFLGDTVESIAREKAGIMKPGRPCVVGPQDHAAATETLRRAAAEKGAPFLCHGEEWRTEPGPDGRHKVLIGGAAIPFPDPSLVGLHQVYNAGTAIRALKTLKDFTISDDTVARGVTRAIWPGRLQRLYTFDGKPLPDGIELWIDGAHNEDGISALTAFVRQGNPQKKPVHFVVGTLAKRDPEIILPELQNLATSMWFVCIPDQKDSHAPKALLDYALTTSGECKDLHEADIPKEAVSKVLQKYAGLPGMIIVTGSLYLYKNVI